MANLRANVVDALRRLGARPRLLPLLAIWLGAPTVRPSLPFALRELLHREGLRFYRLRGSDRQVAIRHGSGDIVILGEVFNRRYYEPVGEAARVLSHASNILDLGGNVGLFGLFAADRWPEARIVAFEPDPDNAKVHELTIATNDLGARWQLVEAAAAAHDGHVAFAAGHAAISHMTDVAGGEGTIEVQAVDVLSRIAEADLLKMDIEGGEWAILADPRFRTAPPRALVLEYHSRMCSGPSPRVEAEQALSAAGLQVQSTSDRGDGQGVLWAWRP
jgi:FkbM family methyltransferase